MAKIYYGNGQCTIEGTGIRGVEIDYEGAIELTLTAGANFFVGANDKKIIIAPTGEGFLNNLFSYVGTFRITSVLVAGNNAEQVRCDVKKVMDYSELIKTNAEDLTTKSENLNAGYGYRGRITKTKVIGKNAAFVKPFISKNMRIRRRSRKLN
tara:strand:- start:1109 stop:1567 length:459 start_codon:yes stop_codon:yes gene_type:complete